MAAPPSSCADFEFRRFAHNEPIEPTEPKEPNDPNEAKVSRAAGFPVRFCADFRASNPMGQADLTLHRPGRSRVACASNPSSLQDCCRRRTEGGWVGDPPPSAGRKSVSAPLGAASHLEVRCWRLAWHPRVSSPKWPSAVTMRHTLQRARDWPAHPTSSAARRPGQSCQRTASAAALSPSYQKRIRF